MNKKLHLLIFGLLLIFIFYLCKDKLLEIFVLEPFGNQIVIHPDNASFDSQETTFSVLTYDSDLGSGVTQVSTCSDDSSWSNGDKTCRDYSMEGANCEDMGSDGKSAFDACKVACDNCNKYTEVKRRLPSPVEEVDEPSYAQFEGSASGGDDFSGAGGVDIREIFGKLDDLENKMDLIDTNPESDKILTYDICDFYDLIKLGAPQFWPHPPDDISQNQFENCNMIQSIGKCEDIDLDSIRQCPELRNAQCSIFRTEKYAGKSSITWEGGGDAAKCVEDPSRKCSQYVEKDDDGVTPPNQDGISQINICEKLNLSKDTENIYSCSAVNLEDASKNGKRALAGLVGKNYKAINCEDLQSNEGGANPFTPCKTKRSSEERKTCDVHGSTCMINLVEKDRNDYISINI